MTALIPHGKNMLFLVVCFSEELRASLTGKNILCCSGWYQLRYTPVLVTKEALLFFQLFYYILIYSCLCDGALYHFLINSWGVMILFSFYMLPTILAKKKIFPVTKALKSYKAGSWICYFFILFFLSLDNYCPCFFF